MTVVFVAGCWDLFHIGHLNYLRRAKELGDVLIVGVVTDELMKVCEKEPIVPFEQRWQIVEALGYVDHVVAFESFTNYTVFEQYGVDIRVASELESFRFQAQREAREELTKRGVEYVILPRTPDISTTKIKEACCENLVHSGTCPRADRGWVPSP